MIKSYDIYNLLTSAASGLLASEDNAQEYAFTAVGMLAGSTVLLLTALWGTCVILANRQFSGAASNSVQKPFWKQILSMFTGTCFSFSFFFLYMHIEINFKFLT